MKRRSFGLAAGALLAGCREKSAPLRVAAASDLVRAFGLLGPLFTAKAGRVVSFTFGSTGLLSRQIAEGAPFDVFAAASASHVAGLAQRGAVLADTSVVYAEGRLSIWARRDCPRAVHDLAAPRFARVAIANPEHAPYGQAALQALDRAGVLTALQPRLVYADNVQHALQFARTGNVEAAIVASSLMTDGEGEHAPVDARWHDPILQTAAVCARTREETTARAFVAFLRDDAREVLEKCGFSLRERGT